MLRPLISRLRLQPRFPLADIGNGLHGMFVFLPIGFLDLI